MLYRKSEKTLGSIPGRYIINSLDVLKSGGYHIKAINRHIGATSPFYGPSIHHPNSENHQPIHRLLGNNHQRIGSKPSGSKHHQPLDHVLEQTGQPSPTPWRVSFVILFKIYFPKFEGIKFLKLSEVKMENENPLLEYALTKKKVHNFMHTHFQNNPYISWSPIEIISKKISIIFICEGRRKKNTIYVLNV